MPSERHARVNETSQATAPNPVLSSLAAAFRHASVGMAVGTPEGELFDINPAFARMLGYERAELFELGLAVISAPGDAGIDVVQWERLVAGEIDAYQREKRYRRKD